MTRELVFGSVLALVLAACGQVRRDADVRYPCRWPGSPGFAGDIDAQGIIQPSGICYHPTRKTMFIVSDEGEVFEIRTDGSPVSRTRIPGDLEGVTVDPGSGLIYIVVEGEDVLLEFDPESRTVSRRFPVNRAFGGNPDFLRKQVDRYDNGLEALVFVPDASHPEGGTFFAGNQEDPACIMEIAAPLRSSRDSGEARILRVLPFRLDDPSALAYDPRSGHLCVVSDADNVFAEITRDGALVRQYAFPGNDQEGIDWDPEGFLYIAQDSGGIIKLEDLGRRAE